MHGVLFQMTVYLAAAVIAVPLSQRLGLGSVLGYLAAGVAIGPGLGLVGSEAEDVQHYAEFGVVLMLFLIGLEIKPATLWDMRHRLFGLGGLQVGLTLVAITAVALALGLPWNQALATGIVLSPSSTAIVMQTLNEKKLARSEGGRASFAVLLFQDLAVVPLLALIPLLAMGAGHTPAPEEGLLAEPEVLRGLAGWMKALLVLGAVTGVILAGRFLTRPIFHFIALTHMPEIQAAAALLFVVGIALVIGSLGLSPALGSFLAGVVLANSEYRHEIESDIAPFKGLLLGLFFITVGAEIELGLLAADPLRILALTVAMMALKAGVLYPIAVLFGLAGRARLLFALALAQAGEFGFFLLGFATESRVLPPAVAGTVLLVVSLSMFLTPALFLIYEQLRHRIGAAPRAEDEIDEQGTVIIAGMGRFGQTVNRILTGLGHKTVVIDSHPDTVARVRAFGIKAFYGAAERPELLAAAGIADAKAVVLALDEPDKTVKVAAYIRRRFPDLKIIARAYDRHHVYQLYAAGTPDSVREVFDSSVRAAKYALAALDYDEEEIERIAETFVTHDRHMLWELAELWDPDVPIERNAAYIAKAREQQQEIEATLRAGAWRRDKAAE